MVEKRTPVAVDSKCKITASKARSVKGFSKGSVKESLRCVAIRCDARRGAAWRCEARRREVFE